MVITDGVDGGLSGSGTMPAADVMVVHFDHRPHRQVQGRIQSNGDIIWENGKEWFKYEELRQGHGGSASGSASDMPCRHAVSSVSGASQPGSTSNAAPLGATCPSHGDSQPRIST